MKKLYITLLFCILFYGNSSLYSQNPAAKFANYPALKNAILGVCIKDMTGKTIASVNPSQSMTPASILKLVTTATALETLGADYRYKTTLARDKQNPDRLLIHGYGDPTLGTARMNNSPRAFLSTWSSQIKQAFGATQNIDILILDDYFGYEGVCDKWLREDVGNYFAAGSYGISVFDNAYELHMNTMRRDTSPVILYTDPMMNIIFTNTLQINTTGKDNGYILGEPFSNKRLLVGNIPVGRADFKIKGDIPNPGLYLGVTLASTLQKEGFTIKSVNTTYELYQQYKYAKNNYTFPEDIFYTNYSFPLKDIIKDINFKSNNHYAEHVLRAIGRSQNSNIYISPLDEGIKKIKGTWTAKGIKTDGLIMYDGCGLSPLNAISPEILTEILIYMQTQSTNSEIFLNSLPKAGIEGTVRSLLKGTRLAGKVYAKSGSIANVRCYAGYYINGDIKYAFVVMVNNYNTPSAQVVKAIENLLLSVF